MKATQTILASEKDPANADKLAASACPVVVRTDHFRCLAYQDRRGKWIDYYHRVELQGKIEPIDLPES
ncbi:MAG TPA: hypothetical protein VJT54_18265 [Verrucomicrobiae bacterium]|nr:hypothetical protein [Verrucomicrobiae bacterium]